MADRDDILALLLGELDAGEAARVRAAMDASAPLRAWHDEARAMLGALGDAPAMEPLFQVSDRLRRTLYDQAPIGHPTPGVGASWWDRLGRVADRVGLVLVDSWRDAGAMGAVRGADGSRRMLLDLDGVEIDLRLEPSATRLAAFEGIGRVGGAPVDAVLWLEVDARREHRIEPDQLGMFELTVGAGRHQLGIERDGVIALTPVLRHPSSQTLPGDSI